MKVVDIAQRREQKKQDAKAESTKKATKAIFDMKRDIMVAINTSIDRLEAAGMDEDYAMLIVMTHLGDLVMGHDLENK